MKQRITAHSAADINGRTTRRHKVRVRQPPCRQSAARLGFATRDRSNSTEAASPRFVQQFWGFYNAKLHGPLAAKEWLPPSGRRAPPCAVPDSRSRSGPRRPRRISPPSLRRHCRLPRCPEIIARRLSARVRPRPGSVRTSYRKPEESRVPSSAGPRIVSCRTVGIHTSGVRATCLRSSPA